MQKYDNPFPQNDFFQEAFDQFKDSAHFQRLEKKFRLRPYHVKFRALRLLSLVASYCFNTFSALTASTAVFLFVNKLTGNYIIAGAATFVFLILLEITKRATAGHFFKSLFQFQKFKVGLFAFLAILTAVSVIFSYIGSKEAVFTFTPPPSLLSTDQQTAYHREQIATLTEQIEAARETRWEGTTTTASQRTIERLTKQMEALQGQVLAIENETRADNKKREMEHEGKTKLNAYHFALFTLFLEFLFLQCVWYLEYYDFRSYAEFVAIANGKENDNESDDITKMTKSKTPARAKSAEMTTGKKVVNGHDNGQLDESVILKAIKNIRNKITTAKYRLRNNIGRRETSERNLETAEKELTELNTMYGH